MKHAFITLMFITMFIVEVMRPPSDVVSLTAVVTFGFAALFFQREDKV